MAMLTTTERPAPLPTQHNRDAADGRPLMPVSPTRRLPVGATHWSKNYVDETGKMRTAADPIPVDRFGRMVALEWRCPDGECGYSAFLPLTLAVAPACDVHGVDLQKVDPTKRKPMLPPIPWGKILTVSDARLRAAAVTAAVGVAGVVADRADLPWWGEAAQFVAAVPAEIVGSWWLTAWWLTRRAVKRGKLDPNDEVAGRRHRKLIAKRARIAAYLATVAGGWIEAADVVGLDLVQHPGRTVAMLGLLAGAGVIGSRPYVRYADDCRAANRPVRVEQPAEQSETAAPVHEGTVRAVQWAEDVVAAIPNTVLIPSSWRAVVGGWGIIIRATKPGAIDIDMLTDATAKGKLRVIAGTFGVAKKAFNFVEDVDDPNQVLMLCQPNPPLAEGKVWGGPDTIDVENGTAVTGQYIDGSPMIEPFYKYGWGAPSKIVTGTTGSGKSENLRKQIIIERNFAFDDPGSGEKKGMYATFLHDFKEFESYGEFRRALPACGSTAEDAYIMRDALIREMHRRYKVLNSIKWVDKKGRPREGGKKWDPRIHGPVLSWIIDEFHEIAKDQAFIGPLETLARKMRACGIRITIGTHLGTLGDTGSRGFRDMLAGGYALLGRTTDGLTSVVTGGQLTADPRQLPKLPGMCLVADGETQTLHGRQSYIPADEDAPLNVYDLLFDDDNNPIGYPAVLPPETLEAFGAEWVAWAEAGRQPGGRPSGDWMPKGGDGAPAAAGDLADAKTAKDTVGSILLSNGGPMDINAIDAALQPFRAGGVKCGVSMARKVLAELVDDGFAFKPKHGFYQITAHVQEDLLAQRAESAEAGE